LPGYFLTKKVFDFKIRDFLFFIILYVKYFTARY